MPGIVAYLLGIVVGLPFLVLPFFEGFIASAMGDIDLSFIVSLFVSAVAYFFLARGLNRDK